MSLDQAVQALLRDLPPEAFPCLYQSELSSKTDDDDDDSDPFFQAPDLAGNAPTSVTLADGTTLLDYDLEPHRRRAGDEAYPTGASPFLGEGVFGSLPMALTAFEREEAQRKNTPSYETNILSDLVADVGRSRSSKSAKRKLLQGALVVFVAAGYSGKRFIYETAKELGVRSIVLDAPGTWSQVLEEEGLIEKFIPLDFSDSATVFDRALQTIQDVKSTYGQLNGVLTFYELAVPLVARLAEHLGLPGNSPEACDNARNKHTTRLIIRDAGLPSPKTYLIEGEEHLDAAAEAVGFPAVIKPISGAASLGVVRVNDIESLKLQWRKTVRELRSLRNVDGSLVQTEEEAEEAPQGVSTTIIMEEYMDGPEVDVDLVFSGGEAVFGSITDNWPTIEPFFNETGSNCPSVLALTQQIELVDLSVKSVKALGFQQGVFHVESKYTSRGPRLIEVNARMGGGSVRTINQLVWGVDLVEEQLLVACGLPSAPRVSPAPLQYIAENTINAKATGTLLSNDYLKPWQDHPDVLFIRPLVEAGSHVVCADDGLPTWISEMMVTKATVEEAIEFIKHIEESLQVPIQP